MKVSTVSIVSIVCILTMVSMVSSSYGFDYFKTMGTMYSINPVYCIMEADPETEPRYEYLREVAISAINEWQYKLEKKTDGNWNMYHQSYTYDQHNTRTVDDFGQCNAFINFVSEPSNGILGTASVNLEQDYYWLEIQTQIAHRKITINLGGEWEDRVSNLVVERIIPLGDVRNTIVHEVGHSLGLEHYYCQPMTEDCIDRSIMFASISTFNGIVKPVMDRDLNMVIRIYGDDGFLGYHHNVGSICLVLSSGRVC